MVDPNTESEELETVETEEEEVNTSEHGNDLRAALASAFEEQKGSEADAEPAKTATERARDEKGRFASKQTDTEPATRVEASEAKDEPIAPPYSWTADQKEHFSQLPREMQQYIIKREQERESFVGRKSQEVSAIKERYQAVDRIVEQYGDVFQRSGVDPYFGLEQLVAAQRYLDKDPIGALQAIAQSYGIDLSQLANGSAHSVQQQQQAAPQYNPLVPELNAIQAKLAAIEQEKMAQQWHSQVAEVNAFANEMDANGKLIRPYMADVNEQLTDEIRILRERNPHAPAREILQQAYDAACWKNPEVRSKLIEAQRQPQIQAQRVQQARLAGSSVRGAPGASTLAAGSGSSVRDALLAAFEAHT